MDTEFARRQMVEQQVRSWDVIDADVLELMASVPRERFIPEAWREAAFVDVELPIGDGEFSFSPKLEGRILQSLGLISQDTVLEIGTGCGFLTACMARQAKKVVSLERSATLADAARQRLRDNGIENADVRHQDASEALPEQRFAAVVAGGSVAHGLALIKQRLAVGGRLFAVVGDGPIMTAISCVRTGESQWSQTSLFETWLRPLHGFGATPVFDF